MSSSLLNQRTLKPVRAELIADLFSGAFKSAVQINDYEISMEKQGEDLSLI
ncbi:hypothetical protein [Litorimonas haliclonae]|uniref:hypothetical protein n=1 Tax=Litorimonas haliclonae TaxID=2081977 RepID=UPI0039EE3EC6